MLLQIQESSQYVTINQNIPLFGTQVFERLLDAPLIFDHQVDASSHDGAPLIGFGNDEDALADLERALYELKQVVSKGAALIRIWFL